MDNIEKTQQKIVRSDFYALKNIEILMPAQLMSHFSTRVHVKALGNSMSGAGIYANDLLVIDRSMTPKHGHLVLVFIFGQFTLKRLHLLNGKTMLFSENSEYKAIQVASDCHFKIIGVLTLNIHKHV